MKNAKASSDWDVLVVTNKEQNLDCKIVGKFCFADSWKKTQKKT